MFCYIALGGEMLDWPMLELRRMSNVKTTTFIVTCSCGKS